MYRVQRNTDMGTSLQQWKGFSWDVTLRLNDRQSVVAVHVVAVRRFPEGNTVEGFSSSNCAPFDDLRALIQSLVLEAAINTQDAPEFEEIELPFDTA